MDLISLAAELLDRLPANRTLGLTVTEVRDGRGRGRLPVSPEVCNVIGALHSSGVAALADAAALAAVLSVAPDEDLARRSSRSASVRDWPFSARCSAWRSPRANWMPKSRAALQGLFEWLEDRVRFTTVTIIEGDGSPPASAGEFDWVARLAPK